MPACLPHSHPRLHVLPLCTPFFLFVDQANPNANKMRDESARLARLCVRTSSCVCLGMCTQIRSNRCDPRSCRTAAVRARCTLLAARCAVCRVWSVGCWEWQMSMPLPTPHIPHSSRDSCGTARSLTPTPYLNPPSYHTSNTTSSTPTHATHKVHLVASLMRGVCGPCLALEAQ